MELFKGHWVCMTNYDYGKIEVLRWSAQLALRSALRRWGNFVCTIWITGYVSCVQGMKSFWDGAFGVWSYAKMALIINYCIVSMSHDSSNRYRAYHNMPINPLLTKCCRSVPMAVNMPPWLASPQGLGFLATPNQHTSEHNKQHSLHCPWGSPVATPLGPICVGIQMSLSPLVLCRSNL